METLLVNLASGKVQRRTVDGIDYLVAPLSLIVPGVLNGSKGALYYPPEEVAKCADSWNGTPLVVYHPVVDGKNVSARHPGVLERSGIGDVRNARIGRNGKLVAQGWFNAKRTQEVDGRIYSRLIQGDPIELSTGLFTDNVPAPFGAVHNGRYYDQIAKNYRPDHLAILPDQVGACSLNDGCGVLVNSSPFPQKEQSMNQAEKMSLWQRLGAMLGLVENSNPQGINQYTKGGATGKGELKASTGQRLHLETTADDYHHIAKSQGHTVHEEVHPSGSGTHLVAKDKSGKEVGTFDPHDRPRSYKELHDEANKQSQAATADSHNAHSGRDINREKIEPSASKMESAHDAAGASERGQNGYAAHFHLKAAEEHEAASAASARPGSKGNETAIRHDRAAQAHRQAAEAHYKALKVRPDNPTTNSNPQGHNQWTKGLSLKTIGGTAPTGTNVKVRDTATSKKKSGHLYPHKYAGQAGTVVEHLPHLGTVQIKLSSGHTTQMDHDQVVHNSEEPTVNLEEIEATYNRNWPQKKRDETPEEDFAGPGRSFPIVDQEDVEAAAHLIGKAADPEAVKKRAVAICKKKGLTVPESWKEPTDNMNLNPTVRSQIIDALVANCNCPDQVFNEEDRPVLEKLDDASLLMIVENAKSKKKPVEPEKEDGDDTEPDDDSDDNPTANEEIPMTEITKEAALAALRGLTEEEFMSIAPSSIKETVTNAQNLTNKRKAEIIAQITANVSDETVKARQVAMFTPMSVEQLEDVLAAIPKAPVANNSGPHTVAHYLGLAGTSQGAPVRNAERDKATIAAMLPKKPDYVQWAKELRAN